MNAQKKVTHSDLTIVVKFCSRRKKKRFYEHLHASDAFREYLDGHDEKTIFMKFPSVKFKEEMMATLLDTIPKYKIITNNGHKQIKIR